MNLFDREPVDDAMDQYERMVLDAEAGDVCECDDVCTCEAGESK